MAQKDIEYIEKVLDTWVEFCKTHRVLAESLKAVLDELKEYKREEKKKADNED